MESFSCRSAGVICQLLGAEVVDSQARGAGSLAGRQALVDVYPSPLFRNATQK